MNISDGDVALVGTGLAPLVAAQRFLAEGWRVLLINPDLDYFMEDSELPFDPLLPSGLSTEGGLWPVLGQDRVAGNLAERVFEDLVPLFPGSMELWPYKGEAIKNFRDAMAPHVRTRTRLWLDTPSSGAGVVRPGYSLEMMERLMLELEESGFKSGWLEGVAALGRCPGVSPKFLADKEAVAAMRGLSLPRLYDLDVSRYRAGLLEFLREKISQDCWINNCSQLEITQEGNIRLYAGQYRNLKPKHGAILFWTPRLTSLILNSAKRFEVRPKLPVGVRLWEQWGLVSREVLDPNVIAMVEDMSVWADFEGVPTEANGQQLSVLKPSEIQSVETGIWREVGSTESFQALFRLAHDALKWENFRVRSLKARAIFEWRRGDRNRFDLTPGFTVQGEVDGSAAQVVRVAKRVADELIRRTGVA